MSLLEVHDLHVWFDLPNSGGKHRPQVHAAAGVSFALDAGERFGLVGESGCGKTTTILALMGLLPPTASLAGEVLVNGRNILAGGEDSVRVHRWTDIAMVFQGAMNALNPVKKIGWQIAEPMAFHGIAQGAAARKRAGELLEMVGIPAAAAERYPHEFSGGMRQRVTIAAALVLGPDLLLADEPVSMLDVSVRAGVLSLLDGLRRDGAMGVLMITHDLSTAAHFADRIAVMYLGRIVEQGPAREVVRHPRHPYTKALLSVVPKRDPRERSAPQILRGETPNPVDVPPGCRFHPRCPVAVDRCAAEDPALREPAGAAAGHRAACLLA